MINRELTPTEHAWRRYFDRRLAAKPAPEPSINYDLIVSTAEEYLDAMDNLFRQRVQNGYKKGMCCTVSHTFNVNVYEASEGAHHHRDLLNTLCAATGVSFDAAIRAARAMRKWYCRSMMDHCPDAEKLLRVMA